ncbi:MAG: hypothetical protein AAFQ67_08400 [Pseudomonadota bacterium]
MTRQTHKAYLKISAVFNISVLLAFVGPLWAPAQEQETATPKARS